MNIIDLKYPQLFSTTKEEKNILRNCEVYLIKNKYFPFSFYSALIYVEETLPTTGGRYNGKYTEKSFVQLQAIESLKAKINIAFETNYVTFSLSSYLVKNNQGLDRSHVVSIINTLTRVWITLLLSYVGD